MKRLYAFSMMWIFVLGLAISTHAELIDRGNGMIYSTDLDVTWLKDANYAMTSGADDDGLMTWAQAMEWAESLYYGGYDDWRLPTFDPGDPSQCSVSKLHEMRYLLYTELGIVCGTYPEDFGPFINVVLPYDPYYDWYWTSTESDPGHAWRFSVGCG